jgi:hypothetical protein
VAELERRAFDARLDFEPVERAFKGEAAHALTGTGWR